MHTALIIDDEYDARRIIRKYLEIYFPTIRVLAESDSIREGIQLVNELQPNFLFLDIKLGDGTGFDLIDQLTIDLPKIIFTTAFDEFAVKAFRYHAIDYLLKPIDPEIFVSSISKRIEEKDFMNKAAIDKLVFHMNQTNRKIGIPSIEGVKFILLDSIVYFEADGSYTKLILKDAKQMVISKPLRYFEEKLEREPSFVRPHKSFIINLKCVEEYQKNDGGFLKLNTGTIVPISRTKKEEILQFLDNYFM
jgi:two-component system LytT family response regulator